MNRFEESVRAALAAARQPAAPEWLAALRREAGERFLSQGLPTTRHEEWRYTNLAGLAQLAFDHRPLVAAGAAAEEPPPAAEPRWRLVFADGAFRPERSRLEGLPAGVRVASLGAALAGAPDRLRPELSSPGAFEGHPFAALALALAGDGALVEVAAGVKVPEPIELLFLHGGAEQPRAAHYLSLVLAGAGSALTLLERHAGAGAAPTLTNSLLRVHAGEGAEVEHLRLQEEGPGAFHLGLLALRQEGRSRVASRSVALGGALARAETRAVLVGEGAECVLDGLYLGAGRQLLDQVVYLDHQSPRCTSRERFKGILDGEARGVFSGRIRVAEGAQQTDADQVSSSLLLSDDAQADARPQLEILADDVKCSHGGAIGQLSEEALFYLRSRGIDRARARGLLTLAFASELVERIRPLPLRATARRAVLARLPGGGALLEAA